jgi:2'-5' RNA ligase
MSKIAVDVVLLPDEEVTGRAIEANTDLIRKAGREIVLNKQDCLPHISLAMGCIDRENTKPISEILGRIAKKYAPEAAELSITGVHITTNSVGEKVSAFIVERTKALQLLHEEVMKALKPYFSYEVSADMIYGTEQIADSTLLWIRQYPDKSSFANFSPHITIGYGKAEPTESSIDFTASRLALCHLGNHCTCRQVLASAEFGGSLE